MNKGKYFWHTLWEGEHLPFHKDEVNQDLPVYFPYLRLPKQSTILVPLCGKSLDLIWLVQQGYRVIGIELVEDAVHQFAKEHSIQFAVDSLDDLKRYFTNNLEIWVADIFTMNKALIKSVDAIYDRAALVALPSQLRSEYVNICLNWLKSNGSILLKTMEYEQSQMEGPPYSVPAAEVEQLYRKCKPIKQVKSQVREKESKDHVFERGVHQVKDFVWLIGQFSIAL